MITTDRQRLVLLGQAGDSLAELAVDEVRTERSGTDAVPEQWREVEFELTGGDRALLAEADALLLRAGLRRSANAAKFERAVGVEPQGRRASDRQELSPASRAGDVILGYLSEQVETLTSLDPAVRRDEPDSVHQMRIATRRLRSTLQAFGPVIWRADTAPAQDELRWLGVVLGEARDAEVLRSRLSSSVNSLPAELVIGPVQARIQAHFAARSADALATVRPALDSPRYFALLDALDALLAAPELKAQATESAAAVLPRQVHRAYRRTARRIRRARHAAPGKQSDVALHQARKAAKRARYAAEAVAPVLGKPASKFASRMKQVQSLLGDHQDSVIARQVERQLAVDAAIAAENAFSYGLLYQRELDAAEIIAAKALRAWAEVSRHHSRSWLRSPAG